MKSNRGFTLLEQSIVIASIGALTAVAMPRLMEWRAAAEAAALPTLAASLGTAMLVNRGGCLLHDAARRPDACLPIADCADAAALMDQPLPDVFALVVTPLPVGADRALGAACTVRHMPSGDFAHFRGYATVD